MGKKIKNLDQVSGGKQEFKIKFDRKSTVYAEDGTVFADQSTTVIDRFSDTEYREYGYKG